MNKVTLASTLVFLLLLYVSLVQEITLLN